jgi:hypothetical protein
MSIMSAPSTKMKSETIDAMAVEKLLGDISGQFRS